MAIEQNKADNGQGNVLWGWGVPPKEVKTEAQLLTAKAEALSQVEKDAPSLGDLNPLIHFPELARKESVDALKVVALKKIEKYEGVAPTRLESTLVSSLSSNKAPELRFVARFETDSLTEEQMRLLEKLVGDTYRINVRTRVGGDGKDIPLENYPPINKGEMGKAKTGGWYMGPDQTPTDSLHSGLFVFKNLGEVNKDNFLGDETEKAKYIIEVREAAIYQTDLVQFVTQVSAVLGKSRLIPHGELLYEIYYDLLRLGLKKIDNQSVYGMEEKIAQIKRGLLIPLASLELARSLDQKPESAIMIGVPGTGKTLIVEELLHEDTGVLILPIDPLELTKELLKDKDKQSILPRIAEVSARTGKRVVLHLDDIENMAGEGNTYSTLLNLMAGVRESGFYVIASTNDPEKIPQALFQPQRFGIRIYCGLQSEEARFEILKIHAIAQSLKLGIPLFNSEEERDLILKAIAKHAEYFTPRYLWEIPNTAKTYLMERVAREYGTSIGLTEGSLRGHKFQIDDFENAFHEVSSVYDKERTRTRDEQLRAFVNKLSGGQMGFLVRGKTETDFFDDLRSQLSP